MEEFEKDRKEKIELERAKEMYKKGKAQIKQEIFTAQDQKTSAAQEAECALQRNKVPSLFTLATQQLTPKHIAQEIHAIIKKTDGDFTSTTNAIMQQFGEVLRIGNLRAEVTKELHPTMFAKLLMHAHGLLHRTVMHEKLHAQNIFNPQGTLLACFSDGGVKEKNIGGISLQCHERNDGTIKIYDTLTKQSTLLQANCEIEKVSFNAQGNLLAFRTADGAITVYNAHTKQTTLLQDYGKIHCFAFNPQGNALALGSDKGAIGIYDAHTKKYTPIFSENNAYAQKLTFNAQGNLLATSSSNGRIRIYNSQTNSGIEFSYLSNVDTNYSTKMAFCPLGNLFAFIAMEGETWYNRDTGQHIQGKRKTDCITILDIQTQKFDQLEGNHYYHIYYLTCNAPGNVIAYGRTFDLKIYDMQSKKELTLDMPNFTFHFNPQGTLLASYDYKKRTGISLYDIHKKNYTKIHENEMVDSLAFHPTEELIASGAGGIIKVHDLNTKQTALIPSHGNNEKILKLIFNPEGTLLASIASDTAQIVRLPKLSFIKSLFILGALKAKEYTNPEHILRDTKQLLESPTLKKFKPELGAGLYRMIKKIKLQAQCMILQSQDNDSWEKQSAQDKQTQALMQKTSAPTSPPTTPISSSSSSSSSANSHQ